MTNPLDGIECTRLRAENAELRADLAKRDAEVEEWKYAGAEQHDEKQAALAEAEQLRIELTAAMETIANADKNRAEKNQECDELRVVVERLRGAAVHHDDGHHCCACACDMRAALRGEEKNPRGMKSDLLHNDSMDGWHVDSLDKVLAGAKMSGRYDCPHCGAHQTELVDTEAELNLASATIAQLKQKLAIKTDAHDKDGKELVKLRAEVERLNGALRTLEKSAREADAGAVADMIAALISTNPRGIKSDVPHLDPVDDLHVEGLDEVLKKRGLPDHNSPEGMALIRKIARERSK